MIEEILKPTRYTEKYFVHESSCIFGREAEIVSKLD